LPDPITTCELIRPHREHSNSKIGILREQYNACERGANLVRGSASALLGNLCTS
jgi:hypothetical protein